MAKIVRDIELRPHVGRTDSGREVRFAQDMIFLNGKLVGFAGHRPGDAVNIIAPDVATDEPTLLAIHEACVAKFPNIANRIARVPILTSEEELDLAEGRTPPARDEEDE